MMLPEPDAGLEKYVVGRLDIVIDADVVEVLVPRADADDVAGLLNGRIGRDLAHALFAAAPTGFHPAEDMHLVASAAR